MAFDAFIKITGITGESTDSAHTGWIEVFSFSWGASNPVNTSPKGDSAGKATTSAFSFTKVTDSASPTLFQKMCQGTVFSEVYLACRKAGASATGAPEADYLKIDFYNVFFTGITGGGTPATDQVPSESITFAFQKVVFSAAPTLATGQLGTPVTGDWNFTTEVAN